MKKKLLMALLVGVLAVPSSVSCFAAESTDAAAADSDEEEETEETEAEDKDTTANIGKISGGVANNVVCPEVIIDAEARSTVTEKLDAQDYRTCDQDC